ncbi:hypothetical protein GJA_5318 [Janthinobacterium agaricidamnosum NBRC 102515 = DSM 9628]|uniref:Uncharacterized protein n=1 Tax=Janthinobacterium agaricidamnosum NBRC 102515 = DSM 9628 TaxID=1349767 RepID=W0VAS2_9BURK|nr:hypothetical protein GJA_5318 [Janthinobacterium agaricidamnosum NBRC 102515 = DSM 9628]
MHVQYAGKNFILRLQHDVINSLYDCLGLVDGIRPMGEVLTAIPPQHHASALKFMDFLASKHAAFRVTNVDDELELAAVKDTLNYLRLYSDDSSATFRRFEQGRILIVAGGFALMSAVKTFARLGTRMLTVIDTAVDGQPRWSVAELQRCFAELRRWPDAELHVISPAGLAPMPSFDHVLHVVRDAVAVHQRILTQCAATEQLIAVYVNGNLCLLRSDDYLRVGGHPGEGGAVSQPGELVAGATASLFFFDNLCNIRRVDAGRYQYYKLNGENATRFGHLYRLLPLLDGLTGDAAPAVARPSSAPAVAVELERLLHQPLFPLQPLLERTDPASHIKLYSTVLSWHDGRTLVAAGRHRRQCEANLLAQLVSLHGLWFDQGCAVEAQAASELRAKQLQAEQVVQPLRSGQAAQRRPCTVELGAYETYIEFCINAVFGQRVRWFVLPTADARFSACTVLCAGHTTLFLPHGGELPPDLREAALLALYAALWQQRNGIAPIQDVLVAASPFLALTEPVAAA